MCNFFCMSRVITSVGNKTKKRKNCLKRSQSNQPNKTLHNLWTTQKSSNRNGNEIPSYVKRKFKSIFMRNYVNYCFIMKLDIGNTIETLSNLSIFHVHKRYFTDKKNERNVW